MWRAYFYEHPNYYPEKTAKLWHIASLPRMMARYNGAIYVRPLEAGRNGSDQVVDIAEYTGKTVIVSLVNDTCHMKPTHSNICRKDFQEDKGAVATPRLTNISQIG